jgi:hypothetical protein
MNTITFKKLNDGWNAEPNDPAENVVVYGNLVELSFALNPWEFDAAEGSRATLNFSQCARWRLGRPNDEGWYRGQGRFETSSHSWGEFYEVFDATQSVEEPTDWKILNPEHRKSRHFLFYLRDNTFECYAQDWTLSR